MMIRTIPSLFAVRRALGHRLPAALAALLLLPATPGFAAQSTDYGSTAAHPASGAGSAGDASSELPKVIIEKARERALRLRVDHFVTSVVVQPWNDALFRWDQPVCPLVAGLPKNWGELILQRISKAALDAHAPLAGRKCHPNLYVLATDSPERFLEKWWAHDRGMYFYRNVGIEAVKQFIHSRRPVRAWYNTGLICMGGTSEANSAFFGPSALSPPACRGAGGLGSHLNFTSSWSRIESAVVVIDLGRMKKMTIQQLGDYVALIGLADLRLDADPGPQPSILDLFSHAAAPQGLTRWDSALLYSLYNTRQDGTLQLPQLELTMLRHVEP